MFTLEQYNTLNKDEKESAKRILLMFKGFRAAQRAVFSPKWDVCCVSSGRGWGKSLVAAAWISHKLLTVPRAKCILIGRTITDAKQINIESLETGVFRFLPHLANKKYWNRTENTLTAPNGAQLTYFGANDPDKLRGSNNLFCVFDEFSSAQGGVKLWWDLTMTMRVKRDDYKPQTLAISTPKYNEVTKQVHKQADLMLRGSTYDNAENLAQSTIETLKREYAGTALERLELYGEMTDIIGALATPELIERYRENIPDTVEKRVISIDPAGEPGESGSATGIVVVGKRGEDLFIESDLTTTDGPEKWADLVIDIAHKRDCAILVETNLAGSNTLDILRRAAKDAGVTKPRTYEVKAIHSKLERAKSASYELHKGHLHFPDYGLPILESQFCSLSQDPLYYDKKAKCDNLDAMVHAVRHFKPRAKPVAV